MTQIYLYDMFITYMYRLCHNDNRELISIVTNSLLSPIMIWNFAIAMCLQFEIVGDFCF